MLVAVDQCLINKRGVLKLLPLVLTCIAQTNQLLYFIERSAHFFVLQQTCKNRKHTTQTAQMAYLTGLLFPKNTSKNRAPLYSIKYGN